MIVKYLEAKEMITRNQKKFNENESLKIILISNYGIISTLIVQQTISYILYN